MEDYLETAKAMAAELSDAPPAPAQESENEVELAITAGVIPSEPGAAYRLGLERGRKAASGTHVGPVGKRAACRTTPRKHANSRKCTTRIPRRGIGRRLSLR